MADNKFKGVGEIRDQVSEKDSFLHSKSAHKTGLNIIPMGEIKPIRTGYYVVETNYQMIRAILWYDADKQTFLNCGTKEELQLDTTMFDRISLKPINLDNFDLLDKEIVLPVKNETKD